MTIKHYDNQLVQAYYEKVLPALVFVECQDLVTGASWSGTATVIGRTGEDCFLPLLATAGHVLPQGHNATRFRLTRFCFDDLANPKSRTAEFTMPHDVMSNQTPGYVALGDKENLGRIDIGLIRGPAECTDGKPWFTAANPSDELVSVPVASRWFVAGTEVAWAGFPGIAATIAERPQPCFYSGVVSALVTTKKVQAYLLDGHNTYGISGGPVWTFDAEFKHPFLIGIISSYKSISDKPQMPGLVFAAPIQTLLIPVFPDYVAKSEAGGEMLCVSRRPGSSSD